MIFHQVSISELSQSRHLNPDPLSFDEWVIDFMAKGRGQPKGKGDCTPGKSYPCKSICLTVNRNCRNPLTGQAKTYADWLKAGGEKIKATKPETSLAKKRRESKEAKAAGGSTTKQSSSKSKPKETQSAGEPIKTSIPVGKGDISDIYNSGQALGEKRQLKPPKAKTTKEAEQWAQQNIGKLVDYSGTTRAIANELNSSFAEAFSQYGHLLPAKLDSIRMFPFSKDRGVDGGVFGVAGGSSHFVGSLAEKTPEAYGKNIKAEISEYYKNNPPKPGNNLEKTSIGNVVELVSDKDAIRDTVHHELGHVVWNYNLDRKKRDEFNNLVLKAEQNGWKPISIYSKENEREQFAELWAGSLVRRDLVDSSINDYFDKLKKK